MVLSEIVPWGRSLEEYSRMFALSESDLNKRILGVGDGPASFNAELMAQGKTVVSIDPIYAFSAQEIEHRIEHTYPLVVGQVRATADRYYWEQFCDADELGQYRLTAMRRFLSDYTAGLAAGRYLPAELPILPFANQQFDLSLCSHFLFLYSEQLSEAFHYEAIRELLRVSAEVRIFPLQTLAGELSPYLGSIAAKLVHEATLDRVRVPYEFQRGACEMLRIRAKF